ncbi:MAG: hypothetical protein QM655_07880 [Nocardioidaceae bacterium]
MSAASSSAYNARSALVAALGIGINGATFLLPVFLCIAWGLARDAEIEQVRRLAGWRLDTQRLRMVASVNALGLGAVMLAVALAFAIAMTWQEAQPPVNVDIPLLRTSARFLLVLLAAVTVSIIVAFDRPLLTGTCAGCGILLTHVVVQFAPGIVGQAGLKLIWPFTGATAVSEAGRNYSPIEGLVSTCVLLVVALWAIGCLGRRSAASRRTGRSITGRTLSVARVRRVALICALAIAVIPTIVRLTLPIVPPVARPSILLQRSQDEAPDQVTSEFFADLQSGLLENARTRVADSEPTLISRLPRTLFVRGPGQTFRLERLIGIDHAEVSAYLVAGNYFICLLNLDGAWQIKSIGLRRC